MAWNCLDHPTPILNKPLDYLIILDIKFVLCSLKKMMEKTVPVTMQVFLLSIGAVRAGWTGQTKHLYIQCKKLSINYAHTWTILLYFHNLNIIVARPKNKSKIK